MHDGKEMKGSVVQDAAEVGRWVDVTGTGRKESMTSRRCSWQERERVGDRVASPSVTPNVRLEQAVL